MTLPTVIVCAAIKDTFGDTRALMGALSVAGLKKYYREMNLAAANMDFDRLRFVSERYGFKLYCRILMRLWILQRMKGQKLIYDI